MSLSSSQNTCAAQGGESNCVFTGCLEKEGIRDPAIVGGGHGRRVVGRGAVPCGAPSMVS